ncbi:prolyl aminopeptidase (secreted protein) [Ophiocordyceps sinensis CO18]|uniref:Prolyl aminopeptidase (Secreted protein) n=1 Tax=Ophiocordyceps sinensis (strain Co18 / CGMCC 3.14243) TaxID=911162 RepID=T5ABC0_OPHSC|nr:prolyl aminopeptidase (secreted protein) [Ophiocordyceps sinensis CO18]
MRTQLALCVLAGAASAARQASNFNVTAAQARAASCGDECLEGIRLGTVADVAATGTSFDWDFYATAANMTRSRAGDMLKLEAVQPGRRKGVKAGTSVWRFQYTTVDLDGTLVPATGFIAFPYGAPRRPGGYDAAVAPAQGARGRSPAPVLVLQGLNDTAVLPPTTMAAVESSCREGGNEIHLSLYPGLEHSPLLQAGAPEWLGWIDARFDAAAANRASAPAGRGAKGGKCSWRTREAFHLELVSLPGDESSPQKGGNATPPYM